MIPTIESKGSWSFGLSQETRLASIEKVSWQLNIGNVAISYTMSNRADASRYLVKLPRDGWSDSPTFPTDLLLANVEVNVFLWAHLMGALHDEALVLEKLASSVAVYFENDVETAKAEALAKDFKAASDGLADRLIKEAKAAIARVQG